MKSKVIKKQSNIVYWIFEATRVLGCTAVLVGTVQMRCFASGIGENFMRAVSAELWPIVLCITVFIAIGCFAKRNIVAGITTIVVGGILTYIATDPTIIKPLGEFFANKIINGR